VLIRISNGYFGECSSKGPYNKSKTLVVDLDLGNVPIENYGPS
jgi:hypothetical protein